MHAAGSMLLTLRLLDLGAGSEEELAKGGQPSAASSERILTELLASCTPTTGSFEDVATSCVMDAGIRHHLIVEAPDEWRDAHPEEGNGI